MGKESGSSSAQIIDAPSPINWETLVIEPLKVTLPDTHPNGKTKNYSSFGLEKGKLHELLQGILSQP